MAKSWPSQLAQMNTGIPGMLLQKANWRRWAMARGSMAAKWVFRTRERFWEPGSHEWQLNANSSATNTNNTVWGNSMDAFTKVPEDVSVVSAAVGLLQIADA